MNRSRLFVLILVAFLLFVMIGSVVAIVSMLRDGGGSVDVEDGSVLVVGLGGEFPEQPDAESPLPGLGTARLSMIEVDSAFRKAAVDDRSERVLIRVQPLAVGYAKVQELRDILSTFSADSGKKTTCWMEQASNKEYYLATACDEIYMAPEGFFLVNGLHLGVTFYKGALDKLGVEAEFTRAGKYKSAIEPMTSTEMSEPFRQMMNEMADSLFGSFVSAIASARDLDEETVRALIDDPPLTAGSAWKSGLIDGLFYRDQLMAHLAGETVASYDPYALPRRTMSDDDDSAEPVDAVTSESTPDASADDDDSAPAVAEAAGDAEEAEAGDGPKKPSLLKLSDYDTTPKSLGLGDGPEIAIIYCEGSITGGSSSPGRSMGSTTIARAIRKARNNSDTKAIVLRVNSPGGSGLASDLIHREVELAQTENGLPVVVSMSDYAASGGYYIAMGADAIVAQPSTLTGSIGVFAGKYNLGSLYEKLGLKTESIKRGEMSDIFAANKSLGEDGQAKLSEFVDEFYDVFIAKVGMGRDMTPDEVHELAQGRVWTGEQAKAIGLVDELGSFRTALRLAKEKADIEGEVSLALYPRQPTFLEQLLGEDISGASLKLSAALDTVLGRGGAGVDVEAADALLDAAPFFATGMPVLIAPYHLGVD
jgi:protease-4